MTEKLSLGSGKWLKFDRYELRNGCIAPVRGAKARVYDPWKLKERPYEALSKVVPSREGLMLPAERPELVAAAIEWCNRYGLLGTLVHRVIAVTFNARWKRLEFADKQPRDVFVPELRTHLNVSMGWRTQTVEYSISSSEDSSQLGEPVPSEMLPEHAPQPGVMLIDLPNVSSGGNLIKAENLDKTWADHFPDVPFGMRVAYDYPPPSSRAFWSIYGEPVHQFAEAAWLLANALDAICRPQSRQATTSGRLLLSQLASCSCPDIELQRDGSMRQRWVASTLLSSLALMAMDDLAGGRLHQCATCRTFFLSDAYQAEYCSDTCRHTMQKRRYRQRQKTRRIKEK